MIIIPTLHPFFRPAKLLCSAPGVSAPPSPSAPQPVRAVCVSVLKRPPRRLHVKQLERRMFRGAAWITDAALRWVLLLSLPGRTLVLQLPLPLLPTALPPCLERLRPWRGPGQRQAQGQEGGRASTEICLSSQDLHGVVFASLSCFATPETLNDHLLCAVSPPHTVVSSCRPSSTYSGPERNARTSASRLRADSCSLSSSARRA